MTVGHPSKPARKAQGAESRSLFADCTVLHYLYPWSEMLALAVLLFAIPDNLYSSFYLY